MLEIPVAGPSAWRAEDHRDSDTWIYRFSEDDLAELERALAEGRGKPVEDLTFPRFGERIRAFAEELDRGRGFQLLRGLPVSDRFREEDAIRLYEALCARLGNRVPTQPDGSLIESVHDLGPDFSSPNAFFWEPHTEPSDVTAFLCLRPGLHGLDSSIASGMTLYNRLLEDHPEWLPIAFKSFATDWHDREPVGSPGWFPQALFCYVDGWLSCAMRMIWHKRAQRFEDVPRITAQEASCLSYLEGLHRLPGMSLTMTLEAGDIQLLNNYTTLHQRNPPVDDPEDPAGRRHLLRSWISRSGIGPRVVSPEFEFLRQDFFGLRAGRPPEQAYRNLRG